MSFDDLDERQLCDALGATTMRGATHLVVSGNQVTPAVARAIVASPAAPTLRTLDLNGWTYWRGLESEMFTGILDDEALRILCAGDPFPSLADLGIASNAFGKDGVDALGDAPFLPRLHSLRLGAVAALGQSACELLASTRLSRLEKLYIEYWTADTLSALGAAAWISRATVLHLPDAIYPGNPELSGLVQVQRLGPDAQLTLSDSKIDDRGAILLAGWPALATVAELNLERNDIGPDGVDALAASPYRANLRRLWLSGNERSFRSEPYYDWTGAVAHSGPHPEDQARLQERFGPGVILM